MLYLLVKEGLSAANVRAGTGPIAISVTALVTSPRRRRYVQEYAAPITKVRTRGDTLRLDADVYGAISSVVGSPIAFGS